MNLKLKVHAGFFAQERKSKRKQDYIEMENLLMENLFHMRCFTSHQHIVRGFKMGLLVPRVGRWFQPLSAVSWAKCSHRAEHLCSASQGLWVSLRAMVFKVHVFNLHFEDI